MKFVQNQNWKKEVHVAPFAGAWIEITVKVEPSPVVTVAPFAGAWIEIVFPITKFVSNSLSRSLRGSVD